MEPYPYVFDWLSSDCLEREGLLGREKIITEVQRTFVMWSPAAEIFGEQKT